MSKNQRTDFSTSADGELSEDDIFAIDISHTPRHSPSSSPAKHPLAHQIQRSKSGLRNMEASGILAALPESSGNSYLNHVFHHRPAATLSTSISSTASSSNSSSSRAIPTAPKPPQERLPFATSFKDEGKHPQSAPVQVPTNPSAMMNRYKKKFKVNDEEEAKKLPPHEIVARSWAPNSFLSTSMLEGAGRTLKGRDLLQVRNAVFRRTGLID